MRKLTIEEMQKLAEERGGKCLSDEYINANTKLEWECKEGHKWEMRPSHVKSGHWCPQCAHKSKISIKDMQRTAKERGGKCLSKEYKGVNTKLHWECRGGHKWWTKPLYIRMGRWCPTCARSKGGRKKKLTIEKIQKIAQSKGGTCLSKEYGTAQTKLKFRCKHGHEWWATAGKINYGRWCPICAGNVKLTLEYMQEIAKSRGGECLSNEYINAQTPLKWRCAQGHEWNAVPNSIISSRGVGSWCLTCNSRTSEKICRETFQRIFNKKFPKRRPYWLINPSTNKTMELDGYNEELQLAFEYQGMQHFKPVNHFSSLSTHEIAKRDKLKRKFCKLKGVTLIEIPYFIKYQDYVKHIVTELKKQNVSVPNIHIESFDFKGFNLHTEDNLTEMKNIAADRGGECLSDFYIDAKTKLKWRCKEGHEWEAIPNNIKRGSWCKRCGARERKFTLRNVKNIAKKRGGKCLSKVFINNTTNLKWECQDGHIWEASLNNILGQRWCPICYKNQRLKDMHHIAKSKGGKCLSLEYIDAKSKLWWECKEGHKWEATPPSITNAQSWCPTCGRERGASKRRLTIEEMQQLARTRGGECLSIKYKNKETKLKWRCKDGHTWWAKPGNVRHGTWCPTCAKE